jgi:hypothetical protein
MAQRQHLRPQFSLGALLDQQEIEEKPQRSVEQ